MIHTLALHDTHDLHLRHRQAPPRRQIVATAIRPER
jgi:hypothetical protein